MYFKQAFQAFSFVAFFPFYPVFNAGPGGNDEYFSGSVGILKSFTGYVSVLMPGSSTKFVEDTLNLPCNSGSEGTFDENLGWHCILPHYAGFSVCHNGATADIHQ